MGKQPINIEQIFTKGNTPEGESDKTSNDDHVRNAATKDTDAFASTIEKMLEKPISRK